LIAGCGYVGEALAGMLRADGHSVFPVRRSTGLDLVSGDLAALPPALDAVVFAVAPGGPAQYESVYVTALGRLRAHVRGARFLLTSSTSVYPQADGSWVDEDSPVSGVIAQGEKLLHPGDAAVRLGGIYGPGRESFLCSVRDGTLRIAPQTAYTNRVHRDDAAGILRHLLALPQQALAPVYNGVDCAPAPKAEVAQWIADRLGVPLARGDGEAHANKRVRNDRILAAGYRFRYPTYREGYAALIGTR
jgi:nucleoside-diphosphate-sugar epimerase